jgi:hypothetical protein
VLAPEIRDHLNAENAYLEAELADTKALQDTLFAEMKGRIKEDDSSVPAPDGPWDYYVRYDLGAQHPIHARRRRGAADGEQVLLDEEAASKGKAFFQVGAASHSPDHALYAWAADEQGSSTTDPGEGPGERRGGPADRERLRQLHLLAGQPVALLDLARRECSAIEGLQAPGAGWG